MQLDNKASFEVIISVIYFLFGFYKLHNDLKSYFQNFFIVSDNSALILVLIRSGFWISASIAVSQITLTIFYHEWLK